MKNHIRRISLATICSLLAAALVACNSPHVPPSASAPPSFPPTQAANPQTFEPHEESPSDEINIINRIYSDHIVLEVIVRSTPYLMDEFVSVYVQVGNVGEYRLSFIHGSGSNRVPDALQISLGNLVGIYKPGIMTMDFQTHALNPGDMLEFDIGFAPFTANIDFPFVPFMSADEGDIEFFEESEDFSPALPGVFEGEVSFSYVVQDSDDELGAFFITDEDDIQILSIGFTVVIE